MEVCVCSHGFSTPVPKSQSEKLLDGLLNAKAFLIVDPEHQAGALIKHHLFEHVVMLTYKHWAGGLRRESVFQYTLKLAI